MTEQATPMAPATSIYVIAYALGFLICVPMVAIYLLVLWQSRLQQSGWGDPFAFSQVPWAEPMVTILSVISLVTLVGVFLFGRLGMRLVKRSRTSGAKAAIVLLFSIVGSSFLECLAIYGLTIGFAIKESTVLPLTYLLMAATPLGYLLLWPRPSNWRLAADGPSAGANP